MWGCSPPPVFPSVILPSSVLLVQTQKSEELGSGESLEEAPPSLPVQLLGLSDVPNAGVCLRLIGLQVETEIVQ